MTIGITNLGWCIGVAIESVELVPSLERNEFFFLVFYIG